MFDLYDMFDGVISESLGVPIEVYQDIIENKCTYWEAQYIITVVLNERTDKLDNAKLIFNSYLNHG